VTQALHRLYLLYHELRPSRSGYSYVIETVDFEKQIDLFVRMREEKSAEIWPELTFDDGHISNFVHAFPLLQARGLKARFFITVGWTGHKPGYMGWPELRSMHDAGQSIGAHGWTHALLTHCGERELLTELGGARLELEDKLGAPVTSMSLPGGRYNRRVLAACKEAGYTQIFTSIPRTEPLPTGPVVGRLNIRGDMDVESIAEFLRADSRPLRRLARQHHMKETAKALLGDRLYERLWAFANRREPDDYVGEATENEDSAHYQ
jgi:peptidoglycan/xylan/chitin deacetylase (PgdA/CDA1 family)